MKNTARHSLLLLAILVAAASSAVAQESLRGRVVNAETQAPVAGAAIRVQGTDQGTVTDAQGGYRLVLPAGAQMLVFSSLGFAAQEVAIAGRLVIDVALQPAAVELEELLVVGYTTQRTRDVSGSVSRIDAEAIEETKTATLQEALKGKVAGVNIQSSGMPGSTGRVQIRGVNFVGGNTQPLYVVDGMYMGANPNLNPEDIASIQVLKDASAAAQYGARGANGVIVITTKKGRPGETRISVESYVGTQDVPRLIALAGRDEWAGIINQAYQNGFIPDGSATDFTGFSDIDWQEEVLQTGAIRSHNATLSGASEQAHYLVNGAYLSQEGAVIGTGFDRANLRVNTELRRGILTAGENIALSRSTVASMTGNPLREALRMAPVLPVRDSDNPSGWGYGTDAVQTFATNPVGLQLTNEDTQQRDQAFGTVFAEARLASFLTYRFNFGFEYETVENRHFNERAELRYRDVEQLSEYSNSRNALTSLLYENLLTADRNFGDHTINGVIGFTEQEERFEALGASRRGFPDMDLRVINAGTVEPTNSGSNQEYALRSYLVRANYAFAGRYLLTASFRRDGSSRFGPGNRYANFAAGSVGWVVSDESFYSALPFLGRFADFLKLRASYGRLGDQGIPNYQYAGLIASNQSYPLGIGETIIPGATQLNLANPTIRWQENTATNFGLDLGFGGFTLTTDYFINESGGLLVQPPLPSSLGARNGPFLNIGSIRNRGLEVQLANRLERGDFSLRTTANLTTIDNEVLSLGSSGEPIMGDLGVTRTTVGGPIGAFYVVKTDGLFQSDAEVQAHTTTLEDGTLRVLQPTAKAGDVRYVDLNRDGLINDQDKYTAGSSFPDFEGGVYFDAAFRNVELSLGLRGSYGQTIWSGPQHLTESTTEASHFREGLQPWTPENPSTSTPRAVYGSAGNVNFKADSDRFLQDGSFLRVQNVELRYTLPERVTRALGVGSAARLYVNGQNLHTFTGYMGWDPEALGSGVLSRGVDNAEMFPNVRTLSVGMNLDL
jgi:TonB-linked SusC/RagA family outer membrane protein